MPHRVVTRETLLARAASANQESRHLDFKGRYENTNECWVGIIKDIVAMANAGGGILIFGAESTGTPSGFDCSAIMKCDIADITNKVFKWTGYHFGDLELIEVARGKNVHSSLLVGESEVPIPFTKPGEYETADSKKKTEFAAGTVYFRHGGKSEIGNHADMSSWVNRHAANERKRMMQGVRTVMTAPAGHIISTMPPDQFVAKGTGGMVAQLSSDPSAIKIMPRNVSDFYPNRSKDVMHYVNNCLPQGPKFNSHDITSINFAIDALKKRPEFATKPHPQSSALYSNAYMSWIVEQIKTDPNFLANARSAYAAAARMNALKYPAKKKKR